MDEELNNQTLVGRVEDEQILVGAIHGSPVNVYLYENDHNQLENRDLEDQHPIVAITGLNNELLSIKRDISTNQLSIRRLETKIDNKVRTANEIPDDMATGDYVFLVKEE